MVVTRNVCTNCFREQKSNELWCSECGDLIEVSIKTNISKKEINLNNFWSLSKLLPRFAYKVSLNEGNTPVLNIKNTERIKGLLLKLESRNPTGTFRDRASTLIVSDAINNNQSHLVGVSTGSFSISISAYAAAANIQAINYVPEDIELSKIEQIKAYGSKVKQYGKTVNEATLAATEYIDQNKYYNAIPEKNILTIEGQKTIGLELAYSHPSIEQLIVPKGSGTLFYSIYKGFLEAKNCNWIESIPTFYAVSIEETSDAYLAESLSLSHPIFEKKIETILRETNGKEIKIEGSRMMDEALKLAKNEGIFIEPASASVISAANILAEKDNKKIKNTVGILTGTGFNALNAFAYKMRKRKKVVWGLSKSSTTKFEILNLIMENKANHGYGLWGALGKKQSLQSIYQHLNELEEKKLILKIDTDDTKNIYKLTNKGFESLTYLRNLIDYL